MASSSACTRIDDIFKLKHILIHEIDYIKYSKQKSLKPLKVNLSKKKDSFDLLKKMALTG
jgi:predicted P-loop ATPase